MLTIFIHLVMSSYGLCVFGVHVETKQMMWDTPLDPAKLFGVVCYSLGIAVIGPTSYVGICLHNTTTMNYQL